MKTHLHVVTENSTRPSCRARTPPRLARPAHPDRRAHCGLAGGKRAAQRKLQPGRGCEIGAGEAFESRTARGGCCSWSEVHVECYHPWSIRHRSAARRRSRGHGRPGGRRASQRAGRLAVVYSAGVGRRQGTRHSHHAGHREIISESRPARSLRISALWCRRR